MTFKRVKQRQQTNTKYKNRQKLSQAYINDFESISRTVTIFDNRI